MAAILNSTILDSAILVFHLKLTHTCQEWFSPFAQKKTFTHWFWLNLMMAAILISNMLNSDTAILDSDTFLSSLRFTQKHSPSTLPQTNSIWLTLWSLPSWILPSWIQPFWTKLWLKRIQFNSNSFILTQLDGTHLEFCHLEFGHLEFSHLSFSSQTHSHLPGLVPTICTKMTSLIHSDSTWWWQPSWILPCWIQTLPCWIQTPSYLLSDSLKNILPPLWLLTQTNSIWLKLIHSHSTWWWQPSWIWPSWICPS